MTTDSSDPLRVGITMPIEDAFYGFRRYEAALADPPAHVRAEVDAWDPERRARCLGQLLEGLRAEKEQFRAIAVHEAGSPVSLTPFMQVDDPIEMMAYWAEKASGYPYEQRMEDVPYLGRPQGRILRRELGVTPGAWRARLRRGRRADRPGADGAL